MKIAFAYPPFRQKGHFPNLPQNRQFIYTASDKVRLYPVVMASAATWLRNLGHDVSWLDGVTRRLAWAEFKKKLAHHEPQLVVLEAKAPIMPKLWRYIAQLKKAQPGVRVVLVGDHISFFPEESLLRSKTDWVITGGNYDFSLVSLAEHLEKKKKLAGGFWWREGKKVVNSGPWSWPEDMDRAPVIDRRLTRWQDYGEAYLYRPCAYVMFARGCIIRPGDFGACTFCIWQQGLWGYRGMAFSPARAALEVENLVRLGVREIFDDGESGVLADKKWLKEFLRQLKIRGVWEKVIFSSNARADQLDPETCRLLKKIGYRLLKVGLESGDSQTLKKINKKETVTQIERGVKNAKDAGLSVMLTIMVGYPWETEHSVKKTYQLARRLTNYKTQAGDCLQASVITPYPGTVLWSQAKRAKQLRIEATAYQQYDMSEAIVRTSIDAPDWCRKIWALQTKPQFVARSLFTVRSKDDIQLLLHGVQSLFGHLKDW